MTVPDRSAVRVEDEGVYFDSEGGNILLLELAGQVTFDESGFTGAAVTNEHELKGGHILLSFGHCGDDDQLGWSLQ